MAEDPNSILLAVPDDAPAIAAMLYESFIEYKPLYTDEAFAATTPSSDQIRARMNEGPIWIGFMDGAAVGTVSVVSRGEALYVRGMAVLPLSRGRRLDESLLRYAENFASAQGYKRLFLSTTPFLDGAIRLYERFGFRRNGKGPHDLSGTPVFTMEKNLGSR